MLYEVITIDVRLGVDPRKANQMVRGVVSLPHGTGKEVRVLALVTPDNVITSYSIHYTKLYEKVEILFQ